MHSKKSTPLTWGDVDVVKASVGGRTGIKVFKRQSTCRALCAPADVCQGGSGERKGVIHPFIRTDVHTTSPLTHHQGGTNS